MEGAEDSLDVSFVTSQHDVLLPEASLLQIKILMIYVISTDQF
jgi:hypothetical protein